MSAPYFFIIIIIFSILFIFIFIFHKELTEERKKRGQVVYIEKIPDGQYEIISINGVVVLLFNRSMNIHYSVYVEDHFLVVQRVGDTLGKIGNQTIDTLI